MKFETKFNVGDRAWLMKNNNPTEVIISAIEMFYAKTNQDRITYNAANIVTPGDWLNHSKVPEDALFGSTKELMKSLFCDVVVCRGANCHAVDGVGHSIECIREYEQTTRYPAA